MPSLLATSLPRLLAVTTTWDSQPLVIDTSITNTVFTTSYIPTESASTSSGLSKGATADIAVGSAASALVASAVLFPLLRRRTRIHGSARRDLSTEREDGAGGEQQGIDTHRNVVDISRKRVAVSGVGAAPSVGGEKEVLLRLDEEGGGEGVRAELNGREEVVEVELGRRGWEREKMELEAWQQRQAWGLGSGV
jgi:hypothetical protein